MFTFNFENLIFPAERRGFLKKQDKNNQTKTHFYKLNIGPIVLRNILGPVFNLYLDQFLTYVYIYIYFVFAETPYFYSVFSKMQNLEKHKNEKKTLFVNTIVLIVLVKMSVFFCMFHFCCFCNFHFFRDVF